MKKKPVFMIKSTVRDGRYAKVYINGKHEKRVEKLDIHAEPGSIDISYVVHKTNKNGNILLNEDKTEILREEKHYHFGA